MGEGSSDTVWAQLVSTTDLDSEPIPISQERFKIGRHKDCDISIRDNPMVSRDHCEIVKDDEGDVWLIDSSANGTLLNMTTKLSKYEEERDKLKHGDEFFVVYKKYKTEQNVGYVFQDMKELAKESSDDDLTQDYDHNATLCDADINIPDSPASNLKRTQSQKEDEPPPKRVKSDVKSKEKKETPSADDKKDDALAETLLCIICQEILHDCISLQPCMHSFCAGCYSEWMARSNECPSCRLKVDRINKNHIVNNLVEAFLKDHPDKKRPEEDIKELESKNKITRDMLYPVEQPRRCSSDEDSSPDETDDYDDSSPDSCADEDALPTPPPGLFGGLNPVPAFGLPRMAKTVCRQCAGYQAPKGTDLPTASSTTGAGDAAGDDGAAGPSTSGVDDVKVMPCPPAFVCGGNQNHHMCQCCMQPMPDRRAEHNTNPTLPPQQCSLCRASFCHAYWGCQKAACDGCLGQFKDLNFGKKCLTSIILDNIYESEILKNYLETKNMSVKELLGICLERKEAGKYAGRGTYAEVNLKPDSVLCYACGLRNFKELAYQYRSDIPKEELPDEVNNKPDCYWGKNCRTQKNKPQHAQRFNHICQQTRTT